MEVLVERCLFKREWNGANVEDIVECAHSGKAHFIATGAFNSLVVKESHQGDVESLPIAARTLLLSADTSEIVVRGVNKFFDIEDVERDLLMWKGDVAKLQGIWLQRKLAGFVVTLFSLDGKSLGVVTKHVVEGPHVDIAYHILESMLSTEQRRRLARDLFELRAAVSCECISLKDDSHHPVPERTVFDNKLVVFSIHKRDDMREVSVPPDIMQKMAKEWGFPSVPCWRVKNCEELITWLGERQHWEGKDPAGEALAEGYVVVIEDTVQRVSPESQSISPFTALLIRLKAKTVKYRVLRSLRSIVSGESAAHPLLFHKILGSWTEHISGYTCLQQAVTNRGVHQIYSEFESYINDQGNKRYRGSHLSVQQAYKGLLGFTEKEAQTISYAPLDVIFLCGLPGVGKTTLARLIGEMGGNGCSTFRYILHLSRDEVAKCVAEHHGINDSSSKHKKRRLRSMVHQFVQRAFRQSILLSFLLEGPGLLIFDACNAKPSTRQRWRYMLPRELASFRIVYLACAERNILASRIAGRRNHSVLRGAEEAQAALYAVGKEFVAPLESEPCFCLDAAAASAEDLARSVLLLYEETNGPAPSCRHRATVYDHQQAERELTKHCATFATSILGDHYNDSMTLARSLEVSRKKAVNTVAVQLLVKFDELYEIISDVVKSITVVVDLPKLSWWERCKRGLGLGNRRRPGVVEKGHTRWLRGWLLDGREVGETPPENVWFRALEDRYECQPALPHVTVFHGPTSAATWVSVPAIGSAVDVTLHSVLIDPFALCLGATVVLNGRRQELQLSPGCAVPLHVTVGHTRRVKASYAGEMFDLFQQRESHNRKLEHMRLGFSVKKSRSKFFNFVQVRLAEQVNVRGVVVVV